MLGIEFNVLKIVIPLQESFIHSTVTEPLHYITSVVDIDKLGY